MDQLSFIDDHIYVGTIGAAKDEVQSMGLTHEQTLLEKFHIALIVNCTEENYELHNTTIEVVKHNVRKSGVISLKQYYEDINKKIDMCTTSNRNVLIHCFYGATRSCTCAIAYFMWKRKWRYDQAFKLVSEKRRECDIPYDVEIMLREYENQLLLGVQNTDVDAVCYNCVISVTVKEGANEEELLARMMNFPDYNHGVCLGRHEVNAGCFGSQVITFQAFVDESVDDESLEQELYNYLEGFEVLSVQMRMLDE